MIVDRIDNSKWYRPLNSRLATALDYVRTTDFSKVTPERYEVMGDDVYALVMTYETKAPTGVWEAHRKFYDVQFVAEGIEQMGYAPLLDLRVTKEYDPANECVLLEGKGIFLTVKQGMFVVFGPNDAHMPGTAMPNPANPAEFKPAMVKKVVVKVLV